MRFALMSSLFVSALVILLLAPDVRAEAVAFPGPETIDPGYVMYRDIAYRPDHEDPYAQERCKLDVYSPLPFEDADAPGFPTVVWFHASGLKAGNRFLPGELRRLGFAVIPVDYRLHPKVHAPAYLEDAAAAVAWTLENIEALGGDPDRVIVSGASAGGYLALMLGLDQSWLAEHGHGANNLAAVLSLSGHTITHFTVRVELGIPGTRPIIDELVPLYHVRADAPPMLLITGDRDLELLGRYEETAYVWRMFQVVGHPDATLYELEGFDHGRLTPPALRLLRTFVKNRFVNPPAE